MLSEKDQETACFLKEQFAVASKSDGEPSDYPWPCFLYLRLKKWTLLKVQS